MQIGQKVKLVCDNSFAVNGWLADKEAIIINFLPNDLVVIKPLVNYAHILSSALSVELNLPKGQLVVNNTNIQEIK